MVTVVAFEFSVMRCQPLRRALALKRRYRLGVHKKRNKKHCRKSYKSLVFSGFYQQTHVVRGNAWWHCVSNTNSV
ncbi:hypothetical protein MQK74_17015 [Vibrio cholerae]|nr:hypothetical protein [Vibrio cholerae]